MPILPKKDIGNPEQSKHSSSVFFKQGSMTRHHVDKAQQATAQEPLPTSTEIFLTAILNQLKNTNDIEID